MDKVEAEKNDLADMLYNGFSSDERILIMRFVRPRPVGLGLDLPRLNDLIIKASEYKKEKKVNEVSFSEVRGIAINS